MASVAMYTYAQRASVSENETGGEQIENNEHNVGAGLTEGIVFAATKATVRRAYLPLFVRYEIDDAVEDVLVEQLTNRYLARITLLRTQEGLEQNRVLYGRFQRNLYKLVGKDLAEIIMRADKYPVVWDRLRRLDEYLRLRGDALSRKEFESTWAVMEGAMVDIPLKEYTKEDIDAIVAIREESDGELVATLRSELGLKRSSYLEVWLRDERAILERMLRSKK